MIIRAAKESELEEIATLQQRVFRPDEPDSVGRYLAYAKEDPTYTLDHTRVIEVAGKLVGHLRIWDRTMRIRDIDLLAAGIGSLCVDPDWRGQGYAHALMADSEKYFYDAGYDLGLLFTIISTPFYEAQGWIPIPLPTFDFGVIQGDLVPRDVRALDIAGDLRDVQEIHRVAGVAYESAAVRSDTYWTDGPARIRGVFPNFGVERDGQLVAYVNVEADDEEVWIKEACALRGYEKAYSALVDAVLAQFKGKKLEGSLPKEHAFVQGLEARIGRGAWGTHDEMMVKGINWEVLRENLGENWVPEQADRDESKFWTRLFGERPFYWWTDIF